MEQAGHKGPSCPRKSSCITRPYFYKVCCTFTIWTEHGHQILSSFFFTAYNWSISFTVFNCPQMIGSHCYPCHHSYDCLMQAVVSATSQEGKTSSYHASRWPCICFYASLEHVITPQFLPFSHQSSFATTLLFAALVQAVHFRRTSTSSMG